MEPHQLMDMLRSEFEEINNALNSKIKEIEGKYPNLVVPRNRDKLDNTGYHVFLHETKGYIIGMSIDTLKLIDYSAKE